LIPRRRRKRSLSSGNNDAELPDFGDRRDSGTYVPRQGEIFNGSSRAQRNEGSTGSTTPTSRCRRTTCSEHPRGGSDRTGIRGVTSRRVASRLVSSPSLSPPRPRPRRVTGDVPVPAHSRANVTRLNVPRFSATDGGPSRLGSDTHGAHSARTAAATLALLPRIYDVLPTTTAAMKNDTGTRAIGERRRSDGARRSTVGVRTVSDVGRRDVVPAASHARIPVRWRASTAGHRAKRNTVAVRRAFHNVLRGR